MKPNTKKVVLTVTKIALSLVFLGAGVAKLTMPAAAMHGPVALPVAFLRFIGVAETLGALGLVLPGLLRIRQHLTPLAAAGLAIIMAGATLVTILAGAGAGALFPFFVGCACVLVAHEDGITAPRGHGEALG